LRPFRKKIEIPFSKTKGKKGEGSRVGGTAEILERKEK
jgi:hypothetical protein